MSDEDNGKRRGRFQPGDKVQLRNGREVTIIASRPDVHGQLVGINNQGVYTNFPEVVAEPVPVKKRFLVTTELRKPAAGETSIYESASGVGATLTWQTDSLFRIAHNVIVKVEEVADL